MPWEDWEEAEGDEPAEALEEAPEAEDAPEDAPEEEAPPQTHAMQRTFAGQSAAASHCSLPSIFLPSPQMGLHVLAQPTGTCCWETRKREPTKEVRTSQGPRATVVGQMEAHCHPSSTVQSLAQPSPGIAFPSSQISVLMIRPSPQMGAH